MKFWIWILIILIIVIIIIYLLNRLMKKWEDADSQGFVRFLANCCKRMFGK